VRPPRGHHEGGTRAMNAGAACPPSAADAPLLVDYLAHVATLDLGDRAVRDRARVARGFLAARHQDLARWMREPAAQRAAELRATGAWPLLVFAIGTGRLRLDLDIVGVKNLA